MKLQKTPFAVAALALFAAMPAGAQTSSLTVQAESMTRSSYVVEGGTRIKLSAATGSASTVFAGDSGTYDIQVFVIAESDGQPTLDLYRDSTKLYSYLYPRSNTNTSFSVKGAALTKGQTLRLNGRANGDAWARVDRIVFTRAASTSTATPTASTKTIEAESMTRSSYAVENATRIKLTAASGTASSTFGGVAGNYKLQVYVYPETDGQPQLEVYRNSDRLKSFTYPRTSSAATLTIDSVALGPTDVIRLLGRANGDAWARVDKIVLTPTSVAPVALEGTTSAPPAQTSTTACANPSGGYEGFGRNTTGGAGKSVYRVTNLKDSGAGSLRDALSQGSRCVVFDVGGTIELASNLMVRGANVTIDGLSAPSPGITLRGRTLVMQGSSGAGNVVVRGIRHRYTPYPEDAMRVYNASNVVFDRVSVSGFGDGAIDVTENSRDVTIQWSILGDGYASHNFPSLIKYETARVTVHHNLYVNADNRNPHCSRADGATKLTTEVVCDVRNNIIWNYGTKGTEIRGYAKGNVVNNYYYTTSGAGAANTIYVREGGSAYVSGNYSANGLAVNDQGNAASPHASVAPRTTDARTAAKDVVAKAGARGTRFGLDAKDQGFIGQISVQ